MTCAHRHFSDMYLGEEGEEGDGGGDGGSGDDGDGDAVTTHRVMVMVEAGLAASSWLGLTWGGVR